MEIKKIEVKAKSGFTILMPAEDYARYEVQYGPRAKEVILNLGTRAYKNRGYLKTMLDKKLTTEEKEEVEVMAHALTKQWMIEEILIKNGNGSAVKRAQRGGLLPPWWEREVERAEREIANTSVVVDDIARECAMAKMGFPTQLDIRHSRQVSEWCTWEMSAPAGWDEPKKSAA